MGWCCHHFCGRNWNIFLNRQFQHHWKILIPGRRIDTHTHFHHCLFRNQGLMWQLIVINQLGTTVAFLQFWAVIYLTTSWSGKNLELVRAYVLCFLKIRFFLLSYLSFWLTPVQEIHPQRRASSLPWVFILLPWELAFLEAMSRGDFVLL
jgi:hypothetical protein